MKIEDVRVPISTKVMSLINTLSDKEVLTVHEIHEKLGGGLSIIKEVVRKIPDINKFYGTKTYIGSRKAIETLKKKMSL